jgi:Fe-S oxidoreductase
MSGRIGRERIGEAMDTGTNMLVTACPTCEQVLRKAAQAMEGKPLVVRDLSDLLWQALK